MSRDDKLVSMTIEGTIRQEIGFLRTYAKHLRGICGEQAINLWADTLEQALDETSKDKNK